MAERAATLDRMMEMAMEELLSGDVPRRASVVRTLAERWPAETALALCFALTSATAAIDMEKRAIDIYSQQAEKATDTNEKELYQWLADWEKEHLAFLAEVRGLNITMHVPHQQARVEVLLAQVATRPALSPYA